MQARARGSRISRKMRSVRSRASGETQIFRRAEAMSAKPMGTAPRRMESTASTARPNARPGRTPAYGLARVLTGMDQFLELEHVLARARADIHQVVLLH